MLPSAGRTAILKILIVPIHASDSLGLVPADSLAPGTLAASQGPDTLLARASTLADQARSLGYRATSVIPAYFVPAPICQT
jgi:hypothetical protein